MKVIKTDNFDRQSFDDVLVEANLSRPDAIALADKLNAPLNESSPYWYSVVENDYVLFVRTS